MQAENYNTPRGAKPGSTTKLDRRDLVNIDLYHNEINTLQHRLNEIAIYHEDELVQEKITGLTERLERQKEHLHTLRNSIELESIHSDFASPSFSSVINNVSTDNFFFKLKQFEDSFRFVRHDVEAFLESRA